MSTHELVTFSIEGKVALIGLDRAEKRNAINDAVIAAIEKAVERAQEEARAIVLYGNGPCFCAGLDLVEHEARPAEEVFHHSRSWHRVFRKLRHGRVPAIAALHGATDRRRARARRFLPFARRGPLRLLRAPGRLARHLCRGRRLRARGAPDRRLAHGGHDAHRPRARRGDGRAHRRS